uniref:Uncharacterized protein n=1 Tax=Anguilla anguilla TaxID=7936 RepID=A0A0E9RYB3_ANGAN
MRADRSKEKGEYFFCII